MAMDTDGRTTGRRVKAAREASAGRRPSLAQNSEEQSAGALGGNIGQQPGRWSGPRLVRRDTAFTRRLFTEVFLKSRPDIEPVLSADLIRWMATCATSSRHWPRFGYRRTCR
jgi:hypothetical protein